MAASAGAITQAIDDRVSNVLKWVLLATAIICFGIMGWATDVTYRTAPPMPDRFLAPDGSVLMTSASIEGGKGAFQRADLMDYGSLYGMGSYFGEDYTAQYLVSLGQLSEEHLAQARYGRSFAGLSADEQSLVQNAMRRELQGVDLSGGGDAHLTAAVASAVRTLQPQIASQLLHHDFIRGWTQAYSLDAQSAAQTADFILYSALTCVARRPGLTSSWTQNWP